MPTYDVFGARLRSPFEFPELSQAVGDPAWTLVQAEAPAPPQAGSLIGDDDVYATVKVRCFRTAQGHDLAYDDTGRFVVSGGNTITWFPPETLDAVLLDAARADVIGRVLALAMHQRGILSLHASAVSFMGRGIALLAPKGYGKSTLATALVRMGGRLLSDDTVPVECGTAARLRPGVHQLRLWQDSARQLARERADEATRTRKLILDHMGEDEVERDTVAFAAAYVLVPASPTESRAATRTALPQVQGTLALIEHSKLGPLLGGADAALMFDQAAEIAGKVPTYLLHVVRDLDRIAEAAAIIREWHQPEARGAQ